MKSEFRYPIVDRKIVLSASALHAGEVAFGRRPGLDLGAANEAACPAVRQGKRARKASAKARRRQR
jgi:hypothetical protein